MRAADAVCVHFFSAFPGRVNGRKKGAFDMKNTRSLSNARPPRSGAGLSVLVSLLATTVLAAGATYITQFMSEALLHALSFLLSFSIVSLLFAMMFKWLPDTDIAWGDVWLGALVPRHSDYDSLDVTG
jgi:hypothetical protein